VRAHSHDDVALSTSIVNRIVVEPDDRRTPIGVVTEVSGNLIAHAGKRSAIDHRAFEMKGEHFGVGDTRRRQQRTREQQTSLLRNHVSLLEMTTGPTITVVR